MKISIRYYSGAGNTKYVAKMMGRAFKKYGHRVDSRKIFAGGAGMEEEDDSFDILGIGFPIYFREAPELVYDLLEKSAGKKRPVFFFATKGLYSGNAVRNVMMVSNTRNFKPVGSIEFFMPGTDFLILFAKKNSLEEKILKRIHSRNMEQRVDRFVRDIQKCTTVIPPSSKWYTRWDDRFVKSLENQYDNHHRNYIGKFHAMANRCIQCLKCVDGCPRNNIQLNGAITFGDNCDVCFGCIHNCPTESIQIENLTVNKVRYNQVELY
jgi:flavodoxin/ferredoxin